MTVSDSQSSVSRLESRVLPTESGVLGKLQSKLMLCDLEYNAMYFLTRMLLYGIGFGIGLALIFFNFSLEFAAYVFFSFFLLFEGFVFGLLVVTANRRLAMIEEALPDFLSLVASDIRSGVTYDRALLLSVRRELGPLAKEIDRAAKKTIAGASFSEALMGMTMRIQSNMFSKTIRLIVEGINSGGNLADLLENTALDIRRFSAMRKEISATVLVYQLFIFAAAVFGAPLIYAATSFLVRIVSVTKARVGASAIDVTTNVLPFFQAGSEGISPDMVFLFSLIALFITSLFGSLAIGVISKGKESDGIQYFPILVAGSFAVFFISSFLLELFSKAAFGV